MKIKIKSFVEVPKNLLDLARIHAIKRSLTFTIKEFTTDKDIIFPIYYEDDLIIGLPRFYAQDFFVNNQLYSQLIENQTCILPIDIKFNYEIDNHPNKQLQDQIVVQVVQDFQQAKYYAGGIITTIMGSGKTIMSLKLIDKLKLKTLVVVHRKILLEQWKQFILKFTDLKEEQIGIIEPEAFIYQDKPITIGMLQTLLSRDLTDDLKTNFGLVIVDEASHISAEIWHQVAQKLYARYTLGLTGTPYKGYNLHKILQYTLGTKMYGETKTQVKISGDVDIYKYTFYIPDFKKFRCDGPYILPIFLNMLTRNQDYNKFLAKIIKYYVEQDRFILIVTDRVKHARLMYDLCCQFFPNKTFQLLIGGVKKVQYVDGYIGTIQYVAEGLDITHIDTLVLTTPRYNIKQIVGRLFRNLDKKKIKIVDVAHRTWPSLQVVDNAFFPRLNSYKAWGFGINMMED